MITVVCVWVRGNVPFTAEYVRRLRNMVARNLDERHRFVCLTDRPEALVGSGIETRVVVPRGNMPGWWAKTELFNARNDLHGRNLYLDLDTIVTRSLREVAQYPSAFALVPHAGTWRGRGGLQVVPRYNSSVMVWDQSAVSRSIYERWTPSVSERLWGDQDWIGELLPGLDQMPIKWFPRISELGNLVPKSAVVVLCKKPKNHEAVERWSWVSDLWR